MSLTEKKEWIKDSFQLFEKGLNGEAGSEFHQLRRDAMDRFSSVHFPGTRNEEWRYTSLPNLIDRPYVLPATDVTEDFSSHPLLELFPHRLVFIDGFFNEKLSTVSSMAKNLNVQSADNRPDLVRQHMILHDSKDEHVFVFMNHAFLRKGIVLSIPANVEVKEPVHLIHIHSSSKSALSQPFVAVEVGESSKVTFFESSINTVDQDTLSNSVAYFHLNRRAVVHYTKVQNNGPSNHRIDTTTVEQDAESRWTSTVLSLGSSMTRNLITLHLNGERIESTINGLYMMNGSQHVDNRTVIHHAKPHCASHELYKGILDGQSTGVFNGKIMVHPDAQKTDAKQSNKNLLLSANATMNTKPQLEIFADDVKCTHGATIGRLDEASMFYLRSRGIPVREAKSLLTHAFAHDVIARIDHDVIRQTLDEILLKKLSQLKDSK